MIGGYIGSKPPVILAVLNKTVGDIVLTGKQCGLKIKYNAIVLTAPVSNQLVVRHDLVAHINYAKLKLNKLC